MNSLWHPRFQERSPLFLLTLLLPLLVFLPSSQALTSEESYQLREALRSFDEEPDIYQVHQAALRARSLQGSTKDRWTTRARVSALLPQIQGQASWLDQRDLRHRFRETISADEEGFYERNNAQHLLYDDLRLRGLYSLRLSFDLSQILFHRQELSIQREVQNQWIAQDSLLEAVTELYFTRRRHQLYLRLFPELTREERIGHHLAIEALTARLDAATGGWFRTQLSREDHP